MVVSYHNPSHWHALSPEAIQSMTGSDNQLTGLALSSLLGPTLGSSQPISADVRHFEDALRSLANQWRIDEASQTFDSPADFSTTDSVWDAQLGRLLGPLISQMQAKKKRVGQLADVPISWPNIGDIGEDDDALCMSAIRSHVPEGHTFKAYPLQVGLALLYQQLCSPIMHPKCILLHAHPRRAFSTALRSQFFREILSCRGDHIRLALKAKIYALAESAVTVWLVFACTYRQSI
ncbi:unnamed protein product [Protopolystoma xenopodis]|uniref:Centrosomal protein of 76 kDa C-terminal domain-containing protein n=1 Tax=Protopolystoma xenopodis TaxID=117903 RepID=A0A3S5B3M7_9PLAT|nr:unnamed protein product [Protopolystoma xenopodis]